MTKFLIALSLFVSASTAAFAGSSALDVYNAPAYMGSSMIDYTATTSTRGASVFELGPRLGDGSPVNMGQAGNIDYTATASIGHSMGIEQTFAISPRAL